MPIDPTGYDKALATIQPGALSERQQRIAAGLALIADGTPGYVAARRVGVPWSTLWRYHHKLSKLGNDESDGMTADATALAETSVDVALIAAEAIRNSLTHDLDQWERGELVRAYAAATDRSLALSRQSAPTPASGQSVLSRLLDGARITIEPVDAADRAVTVPVTNDES